MAPVDRVMPTVWNGKGAAVQSEIGGTAHGPRSPPTLGGVFLLFGTRPALTLLTIVTFRCDYCGHTVAQHVYRQTNKFTVFFLPLFSFSTSYFVECTNCGGSTALTEAQARRSVETAGGTAF
jgi:hypothetical protein